MIRVRLAPDGTFAARRSWAVARADDAFPETSFEIEESGQALVLRTSSLTVRIERERGSISFADVQGQPFCVDEAGSGTRAHRGHTESPAPSASRPANTS